MLGGVTVNAILGIAIYIMIAFVWGNMYLPNENLTYGIYTDTLSQSIGLQNGDKILSIDGEKVDKFIDVRKEIILNRPSQIEIERDGRQEILQVPSWFTASAIKSEKSVFIEPAFLATVAEVMPGSNAEEAGLQVEDRIVKLDNDTTPFFQDVVKYLKAHKEEEVTMHVLRGAEMMSMTAVVAENGTLGFRAYSQLDQLEYAQEEYNALTAIPAGFRPWYWQIQGLLQISSIGL